MVMAIAEEMKKLTENIIISNDVRLKAMGGLVTDTHEILNRFSTNRKKMAAQQSKNLAGFINDLSEDVRGMLKNARNMVRQFHKENVQMNKEQARNLADFVNGLVSGVGSMLKSFQKDHNHMSREMKAKLSGEIKDIQTEVERILGEADDLLGEYGAGMAQAKKAWRNMSAALTRARKAGFISPEIDDSKKVKTVKQATRKTRGKKGNTRKSSSRKAAVGV